MEIMRVAHPEGIDFIDHLIIADKDSTREGLILHFKELLVREPETCYFLLAAEDSKPQAFLLAYADLATNYVFLQQAWASPSVDPSVVDNMFYQMVTWAHSVGRETIMMETTRSPKVFERRWNFELSHYVLTFSIPQDYEKEFHKLHQAVIGKDNKNVKAKNFREVHSIESPTERGESSGSVPDSSNRPGTTAVRPRPNSPVDPGITKGKSSRR